MQLRKSFLMALQTEGIISERAYNLNEKTVLKRAIAAVLTEIGFTFTGFKASKYPKHLFPRVMSKNALAIVEVVKHISFYSCKLFSISCLACYTRVTRRTIFGICN